VRVHADDHLDRMQTIACFAGERADLGPCLKPVAA
jgi:hypothetical protein